MAHHDAFGTAEQLIAEWRRELKGSTPSANDAGRHKSDARRRKEATAGGRAATTHRRSEPPRSPTLSSWRFDDDSLRHATSAVDDQEAYESGRRDDADRELWRRLFSQSSMHAGNSEENLSASAFLAQAVGATSLDTAGQSHNILDVSDLHSSQTLDVDDASSSESFSSQWDAGTFLDHLRRKDFPYVTTAASEAQRQPTRKKESKALQEARRVRRRAEQRRAQEEQSKAERQLERQQREQEQAEKKLEQELRQQLQHVRKMKQQLAKEQAQLKAAEQQRRNRRDTAAGRTKADAAGRTKADAAASHDHRHVHRQVASRRLQSNTAREINRARTAYENSDGSTKMEARPSPPRQLNERKAILEALVRDCRRRHNVKIAHRCLAAWSRSVRQQQRLASSFARRRELLLLLRGFQHWRRLAYKRACEHEAWLQQQILLHDQANQDKAIQFRARKLQSKVFAAWKAWASHQRQRRDEQEREKLKRAKMSRLMQTLGQVAAGTADTQAEDITVAKAGRPRPARSSKHRSSLSQRGVSVSSRNPVLAIMKKVKAGKLSAEQAAVQLQRMEQQQQEEEGVEKEMNKATSLVAGHPRTHGRVDHHGQPALHESVGYASNAQPDEVASQASSDDIIVYRSPTAEPATAPLEVANSGHGSERNSIRIEPNRMASAEFSAGFMGDQDPSRQRQQQGLPSRVELQPLSAADTTQRALTGAASAKTINHRHENDAPQQDGSNRSKDNLQTLVSTSQTNREAAAAKPLLLRRMEQREAERQRRKAERLERQRRREQAELEAKRKAEEEERQREEEARRTRLEERRRKQQEQKRLEEEKRRRQEELKAKTVMATSHHEQQVMRRCFRAWHSNINTLNHLSRDFKDRSRASALRQAFNTWRHAFDTKQQQNMDKAARHHHRRHMKRCFEAWQEHAGRMAAVQTQAAKQGPRRLLRRMISKWHAFADHIHQQQRPLRERLVQVLVRADEGALLRFVLRCWKHNVEEQKQERERERRISRLRDKVKQILPDFEA